MRDAGMIDSFTHHAHHTAPDRNGKDFTVRKLVDGVFEERSFGVTVSPRRRNNAECKHPATPQFWIPPETKPETIVKKVNGLFACCPVGA